MQIMSIDEDSFSCGAALRALHINGGLTGVRPSPAAFQGFTTLKSLVLAYCRLTTVPPAVAQCSGLEHLGLDHNPELQLGEACAQVLMALRRLQTLSALKTAPAEGGGAVWTAASLFWVAQVAAHFAIERRREDQPLLGLRVVMT